MKNTPKYTAQESVLTIERSYPNGSSQNLLITFSFKDSPLVDMLKSAITHVIEKNDQLKTRVNKNWELYIGEHMDTTLETMHFASIQELKTWCDKEAGLPFFGFDQSLIKFSVAIVEAKPYIILKVHHLVCDAFSWKLIIDQINDILFPSSKLDLTVSKNGKTLNDTDASRAYWDKLFNTLPENQLNFKNKTANLKSQRTKKVISEALSERINAYTKSKNTSVLRFWLTIISIYKQRITRTEDATIGVVLHNRFSKEAKTEIGMFASTMPFRTNTSQDATPHDYLTLISTQLDEAIANSQYEINGIYQDIREKHKTSSAYTLFDTVINYQNVKYPKTIDYFEWSHQGADLFPLVFHISHRDLDDKAPLSFEIDYQTDVYTEIEIENFTESIISIADQFTTCENDKIKTFKIVSPLQEEKLRNYNNHLSFPYPQKTSIVEIFQASVEKYPNKIAISCDGKSYTYQELNNQADKLAACINSASKTNIGIGAKRSAETIIAMLAILKTGNTYVPIDNKLPTDRIEHIIKECKIKTILANEFPETVKYSGKTIKIETTTPLLPNSETIVYTKVEDSTPAYIMYTSGSTGMPKGVIIPQSGIIRLTIQNQFLNISPNDHFIQTGAPAFDAVTFEIWGALLNGATLFIPSDEILYDATAFTQYLATNQIKTMWLTSGFFNFLMDQGLALNTIKHLLVGGDVLSSLHIQKCYDENPSIQIFNGYGPTENTTFSAVKLIDKNKQSPKIPIGRPFRNTYIFIADQYNHPLPQGIIGEICVAGAGLALGYQNNEPLTNQKFISSKNNLFERFYKTGDLGYINENWDVEFEGRLDNQVKIRGNRLELDEVSFAISKAGAEKVQLVVTGDNAKDKKLIAFIVLTKGISIEQIRKAILKTLPDFAIPEILNEVSDFPLTRNGKVDVRTLLENMKTSQTNSSTVENYNETENNIANLWVELLGHNNFDKNTDLFACGGNSIKVMELAALFIQRYQVKFLFHELLTNPTIAKQALKFEEKSTSDYQEINKYAGPEDVTATASQQRIYFLSKLQSNLVLFNIPIVLKVKGSFDLKRAFKAFYKLLQKHESLRSSFVINNEGKLKIQTRKFVKAPVSYSEHPNNIQNVINDFIRPFDLENAPLLRTAVYKIGPEEYLLLFDIHHIIADGISLDILKREFKDLYASSLFVYPNKIDFSDYAHWVNNALDHDTDFLKQKTFWNDELVGYTPLDFPTDYVRPSRLDNRGDEYSIMLGTELSSKIKELVKRLKTTPHILMLSIYKLLIHFYTNQNDIIVGVPVNGRIHPQLNKMVGCFINLLPIRTTILNEDNFGSVLEKVMQKMSNGLAHQSYPFDQIVADLNLPRDTSRNPIVDTVFVFQENPLIDLPIEGLEITPYGYKYAVSKYDLLTELFPIGEDILLNIGYATSLFDKSTIVNFANHYINLLENICEQGQRIYIKNASFIDTSELKNIVETFNDTHLDYDKEQNLYDLFLESCKKNQNKVAISCGTESLTYGELLKKSESLAAHLISAGIQPGDIVGIMVKRDLNLMVPFLATLKIGATYIPMDPEYPAVRVKYMMDKAQVKTLIVNFDSQYHDGETPIIDLRKINLDGKIFIPKINFSSENVAYLIFTSGSTGNPKGVMISHRAVHNFIIGIDRIIPFANKKVLGLTTISFDIFVLETYLPLILGGEIVVATELQQKDSRLLNELIIESNIDYLQLTPSRLQLMLFDDLAPKSLSTVEKVMVGGEALPEQLFKEISQYQNLQLFNMYGPTETTVWSAVKNLTQQTKITLGKPIANTQIYVLNDQLRVVPVGHKGEIYIAGDGLAKGYFGSEELTNERFIPNPFIEDTKMYRTGDIGKWNKDGEIIFEGRADFQVKIRGYRIEIGEVENAIRQLPSIKDVVVVAEDQGQYKRLLGYFIANESLSNFELRTELAALLPDYMIPEQFVQIENFPLTPNGKLDKKALPKPSVEITQEVVESELSSTEQEIKNIWETVLNRKGISVYHNFFEIGGNSLSIILMNTLINNKFPGKIQVADIFSNPTISKIASLLDKSNDIEKLVEDIKFLPIQEAFFAKSKDEIPRGEYSKLLEKEFINELELLAKAHHISLNDFIVLAFIYSLYQVSNTESVTVHNFDQGNFETQTIDFKNIEDLENLITAVVKTNNFQLNPTNADNISSIRLHIPKDCIIPAVFYNSEITWKSVEHLYDLILHLELMPNGQGHINLNFNGQKINPSQVKSFFVEIIQNLDAILAQLSATVRL